MGEKLLKLNVIFSKCYLKKCKKLKYGEGSEKKFRYLAQN